MSTLSAPGQTAKSDSFVECEIHFRVRAHACRTQHQWQTRLFSGDANTHFQLAVVAVTVVSRHRSDFDFKFDGYDTPHFQFTVVAVTVVSRHRSDIDFKFDGYDAPHFQFTVVAVIVVSRQRSDSDFNGTDVVHFQLAVAVVLTAAGIGWTGTLMELVLWTVLDVCTEESARAKKAQHESGRP